VEIKNEFTVSAPIEEAWAVVLDLERIAPCLPGAAIQEQTGDGEYAGTMKVKIGPITASYKGTVKFQEIDEENHRAVLNATGRDPRGGGTASATIVSTMNEENGGTKVNVETDMKLTGRAAQFGRGIAQDVAAKMLDRFAACLEEEITGAGGAEEAAAEEQPAAQASSDGSSSEETPSAPSPAAVTGGLAASPVDASTTAARPVEPVVEGEATVQGAVVAGGPSEAPSGPESQQPQADTPRREPSAPSTAREQEPLDLAEVGGGAVLKRLVPVAVGAAALVAVVWLIRRRS
jgi:carbon monoxide dehydrogenase subunit G